jgi:Hint domain
MQNASPDIATSQSESHWPSTRRNLLAAGAVFAGSLLAGCKRDHTLEPHCFARRTHILSTEGEQRIEELKIGDHVLCMDGQAHPIRWIARRRLWLSGAPSAVDSLKLLCIPRSSLGRNVPHTDLFVSAGHRILLDNFLVAAADLPFANRMDHNDSDQLLFHILLDQHSVIFAEGAPCETLLPNKSTLSAFDNADELTELGRVLSIKPCAPELVDTGNRAKILSYLRNAISPLIDYRNPLDKIRDRLLIEP